MSDPQHYFLVTGEIIFQLTEGEELRSARVNAVVMTHDGRLAVQHIGRAQQALQMHFHRKLQEAPPKVVDVIILGLMPLGIFTPEEFNAAPGGMILQESQHEAGHA